MNKQKTQLIVAGILIFLLGISLGHLNKSESEIKYVNNTVYLASPYCASDWNTNTSKIAPTPTVEPIKQSSKSTYKYGGIPTSIDYPPNNAVISKELTEKNNNHTIAVDEFGNKYYFVGGWGWFNQEEYNEIPYKNKLYDVSPYWSIIDN